MFCAHYGLYIGYRMGLSGKIIIKEVANKQLKYLLYLYENHLLNFFTLPRMFGILKITLNVELTLGGLKTNLALRI